MTAAAPAAATPPNLRAIAERSARIGGSIARDAFGKQLDVRRKADHSEVTDADLAAQDAIIRDVRSDRAGDGFLGEEGPRHPPAGSPADDQTVWWVIDPIDGTRNYVRGVPLYCTSVAAVRAGVPVAGAIYDPMQDTLFSADRESGMFVQGTRFTLAPRTRAHPPDGSTTPLVAIPSTVAQPFISIVDDWVARFVVRNLGSTALHLAMVAAGRLDAVFATNCRIWDIAAGAVLIEAAGGVFTSPHGNPVFPIDPGAYTDADLPCLGAGRELHGQLLARQSPP